MLLRGGHFVRCHAQPEWRRLPNGQSTFEEVRRINTRLKEVLINEINEIGIENLLFVDFNVDHPPSFDDEESVFESDSENMKVIVPFVVKEGRCNIEIIKDESDKYLVSEITPAISYQAMLDWGIFDEKQRKAISECCFWEREQAELALMYDKFVGLRDKYPTNIYVAILEPVAWQKVAGRVVVANAEVPYFMELPPEKNVKMSFTEGGGAGYFSPNSINADAMIEVLAKTVPGFQIQEAELQLHAHDQAVGLGQRDIIAR